MQDLFDAFLSFNANFAIQVKHNGNLAEIVFSLTDTEEPVSPIIIKIEKGEPTDPEAIHQMIKSELETLYGSVAPFAEQMAAFSKSMTKNVSKVSKTKATTKTDDKKVIDLTSKANVALANPKLEADEAAKLIKTMQDYNKQEKKNVTASVKTSFDSSYMKLNAKYDELKSDGGLF